METPIVTKKLKDFKKGIVPVVYESRMPFVHEIFDKMKTKYDILKHEFLSYVQYRT